MTDIKKYYYIAKSLHRDKEISPKNKNDVSRAL